MLDEAPGDVVAEPLPVFLLVWLGVSRSPVSSKSLPASGERAARPFVCVSLVWQPLPAAAFGPRPRAPEQ